MPRQNINTLVLDAVCANDSNTLKKLLDGCRNVQNIGKEAVQMCAMDNHLECLKILYAAGACMEDAFSLAALHGHLDMCKWFAFDTEEKFPVEFAFLNYPDHPEIDEWVKQVTLRGGAITLKSIARDLYEVSEDPSVNDGARVLLGQLITKYWSKNELLAPEENVSNKQ